MNKYLVQFDESNIGIAWSKGEVIEAETEEEAINTVIKSIAEMWFNFEQMKKDAGLGIIASDKSISDFEEEKRSYTWKATLI